MNENRVRQLMKIASVLLFLSLACVGCIPGAAQFLAPSPKIVPPEEAVPPDAAQATMAT